MAGPQLELMPGETMILHSHPHWWFFWKQVAAGIGVIALLVLFFVLDGTLGTITGWLTLLAFAVWLMNTIYQFFAWQTTRFAVTDQRVAYQSGFFKRRGVSIPLNRVNNINFEQNFVARLLDNGVVTIESAGERGDSVFQNIPAPEHVRNVIFGQVEADEVADSHRDASNLRDAMHGLPKDSPPLPPPGSPSSTTERLQQLTELRDSGLVTPEEFEAKRHEILGNL
jgi:uncharacterized membrane protein YdbT with pleckstrin-like domain